MSDLYYTGDILDPAGDKVKPGANVPLTLGEYYRILDEIAHQPLWRVNADKEADYADGNQLDTELLKKMKARGIPPAKENIIGPAIRSVCGWEAKTRTDWRVTPDGDPQGEDVAAALNYKLNQAERHSGADRALSEAFKPAAAVGLGWVEVTRAASSLKFPFACNYVHRNEIWWDMRATKLDLEDARWLIRRRWVERNRAALLFPKHKRWLEQNRGGIGDWLTSYSDVIDATSATGLKAAVDAERGWYGHTGEDWYRNDDCTVCVTEVWYRRWVKVTMLRMTDGRSVEYNDTNMVHSVALQIGKGKLFEELHPRMRMGYWIGPHRMEDVESPFPHHDFPYVPVFGFREDLTGVPFGMVRDMLFPQDNLNSTISRLRWGLSARRSIRTKGATEMTDAQFRRMAARPDADFVLDPKAMSEGGMFRFETESQMSPQFLNLMNDSRSSVQRVANISAAFSGQGGTATSGSQEATQVEQSQVALADLMDSFSEARKKVGELLLSLLMEDMGKQEQVIVIEGDAVEESREVVINKPETDPLTGMPYLSNNLGRTRLTVSLEDVPSTSSFRAQQRSTLSEAIKSLPPAMQQAAMPHLIALMDTPHKSKFIEDLNASMQQEAPEQIEERVKRDMMYDLEQKRLQIEERKLAEAARLNDARIEQIMQQAVQIGVQAAYSAMQAGAQVAQMPQIAPIADVVMQGAGYRKPNPGGEDPNFPTPERAAAMNMRSPYIQGEGAQAGSEQLPQPQANTSPAFPPVPAAPGEGMNGIETPRTSDNLPAQG